MGVVIGTIGTAIAWLSNDHWIVLGFEGGFAQYLENCYFSPGTPRNAEFEVMAAPMMIDGVFGIGAFYRIEDTVDNREAFRAALSEFHELRLLSQAELDIIIEKLRQDIRKKVVPALR